MLNGGLMRWKFITKIGETKIWRRGTTFPCSFVRKSMYRYGFHAKRFADLEVAPEILEKVFWRGAGFGDFFSRWNFYEF